MADPKDDEPTWLTKKFVLSLHAETLHQFGGTTGLRNEGRLEGALHRPRNLYVDADPSRFELAAAYCHGIVRIIPSSTETSERAFWPPGRFCSEMDTGSIPTRPKWFRLWNEWRPER